MNKKPHRKIKFKRYTRFRSEVPKNLFRMPLSITAEMDDWLTSLGQQMKMTGGYKLPKTYLVRSILNAVMELDIDVKGIKKEADLVVKVSEAIEKYGKKK